MLLEKSFLRICLSFTLYLSTILALAVFGYFTTPFVAFVTILFVAVSLYFIFTYATRPNKEKARKTAVISFFIIIIFSFFVGYFHHDLPTARDDLSYIYAANRLTISGSLEWDDYFTRPLHGVRNLGGDTFTSQFLPTYTSYLAVYNMFGGLELLMWANALLILFTFGVIYYLVKALANRKASLIALILLLSSYVFFWFPKRTNVENISIFLIWLGVWLAVLSIKNNNQKYLLGGLIPFSLLALTRPEGLIFFVTYLLVATYFVFSRYRKVVLENKIASLAAVIATLANLLLFYFYITYYEAGYILTQAVDVLEGFDFIYGNIFVLLLFLFIIAALLWVGIKFRNRIDFQKLIFWAVITAILGFEILFVTISNFRDLTWTVYRTQYVLENFVFYFYFIFIFIILLGLRKKLFTQKEFIITMLLLPAFFFIIEPNIALDQPWFMRRFFPNLVPLLIILSAVIISRLQLTRKKLILLMSLMVGIGLLFNSPIMFFVEHKGIRNQLEEFNCEFSKNSLILMNPGWSWQKIALLQHYFYDYNSLPNYDLYRSEEFKEDLPELIRQYPNWENDNNELVNIINWKNTQSEKYLTDLLDDYPEVFVVTENNNLNAFYSYSDDNLEKLSSFSFSYPELSAESNITGYIKANSKIDLTRIRKLQNSIPPNSSYLYEVGLDIYKVIDPLDFIPSEYVLSNSQEQKQNEDYAQRVLKESDLKNYRDEIKSLAGDLELIYGEE
ncbi:glycosyltransferase family 39 protein [Patescibacteria group bacterium]|nr:glycosyltransferase family 39 protein [Patescibacteria group bacterium]